MPAALGASQLPSGGQFMPNILIATFGIRSVWAPIHLTYHLDVIGMRWSLLTVKMIHMF